MPGKSTELQSWWSYMKLNLVFERHLKPGGVCVCVVCVCVCVCIAFLGPHPRHVEVPRPGVELELQLPATASHSNAESKPPLQPTPQLMASPDP